MNIKTREKKGKEKKKRLINLKYLIFMSYGFYGNVNPR